MNRTIVWFRRDLRIRDHAPLYRAARRGAVIPVFILDRALLHHPETAPARVAFMLDCLTHLDQDLRQHGGRLIVRSGDPVELLPNLIRETNADGIYAYIDYERIYGRVRDARLNRSLMQQNLNIRWFEPAAGMAELLPYPTYRSHWWTEMKADVTPTPALIQVPPEIPSDPIPTLAELGLIADEKPIPSGSAATARQLLSDFLEHKVDRYYWQLSYPGAEATTGLSPHLKFGVISARECVHQIQQHRLASDPIDPRAERSRQQLLARLRWGSGFAQRFRYLPQLELRSLYQVFDQDGWPFDPALYEAWQTGQTGFPIVDAAARCLQATGGWQQLNFRVRAIYASFLSNLLGMDWRYGALHFMRHLIDGDCPIDHYQWAMQAGVTHCADKTWTRIYHPGQVAIDRCDPEGRFIKHWLPELEAIPPAQLGAPPPLTTSYPAPILDYTTARQRRIQQLDTQRQTFLRQSNLVPHLARMPASYLPFGADRHPSEVEWTQAPDRDLFPAALDLDALDQTQAQALRTWFVAHVEIKPRTRSTPSRRSRRSATPFPRSAPAEREAAVQLNLLDAED